jgi:hypothetical protein
MHNDRTNAIEPQVLRSGAVFFYRRVVVKLGIAYYLRPLIDFQCRDLF